MCPIRSTLAMTELSKPPADMRSYSVTTILSPSAFGLRVVLCESFGNLEAITMTQWENEELPLKIHYSFLDWNSERDLHWRSPCIQEVTNQCFVDSLLKKNITFSTADWFQNARDPMRSWVLAITAQLSRILDAWGCGYHLLAEFSSLPNMVNFNFQPTQLRSDDDGTWITCNELCNSKMHSLWEMMMSRPMYELLWGIYKYGKLSQEFLADGPYR